MARQPRRAVRPAKYPFAAELAYKQVLVGLVAGMRAIILEELAARHERIASEAGFVRVDEDEDEPEDQSPPQPMGWVWLLELTIATIADRMVGRIAEASARLARLSRRVDAFNKAEWQRQVRQAYGVDILRGEPWLASTLSGWEQVNLGLIKSIPEQTVQQLRGEFVRGFTEGQSLRQMTKTVQERTGVAKARAQLIAVDQVAKLNARLAEYRQRAAGIESYRWITMQDERVRPTHRVRHGKVYRWDAAGIRPGSEVRCRCIGAPVFPDAIDAEISRAA